ncbi:hypothetical protein RclHR1_09060019 [Rhizophagus clarus]|uniref:Uncharacterized protein n=1 Tax=Rhizophagus clarus TaxID=94130 RepID=A0A2Z6SHL1_9GLOM|nr:hypothetical protein RclHR1_09060019 [Rhizophagus clarus]
MYHGLLPEHLYLFFACINKAILHLPRNIEFSCMKILSIMSSNLEVLITELEAKKTDEKAKLEALEARILKLEHDQAEREVKKNRKFQTRCIQIAKEILKEEPIIEYRPPFLNGLELDAFFQKYR